MSYPVDQVQMTKETARIIHEEGNCPVCGNDDVSRIMWGTPEEYSDELECDKCLLHFTVTYDNDTDELLSMEVESIPFDEFVEGQDHPWN